MYRLACAYTLRIKHEHRGTGVLNEALNFAHSYLVIYTIIVVINVSTYRVTIMQIMTGIEVNSEAYFPKLREYCPSA